MTWIASLWSSSSLWEGIEYAAEALVVICALLEVLADFEHILKGDENKARRKTVEKRAAIGLVIGLAIGLGALVRTNSLFTDTIASAYREARDASDRATNANGQARVASDKATLAQNRADKAEQQAGAAIVQAARLNKEAEDERLERRRLEARVAPRSLSIDQQRTITAALHRFSGHAPVIVSSYGLDGEGAALGAQIISVLTAAGISSRDERAQTISSGGFELGVHIRGPSPENAFLLALYTALSSTGNIGRVRQWSLG
jgi:hypothetical protein